MQEFHHDHTAWLLQEPSSYLKNLSSQKLHYDPITYKQVTMGRDMAEIPPEELVEYGVDDSINALALYDMLAVDLAEAGLAGVELEVTDADQVVEELAEHQRRGHRRGDRHRSEDALR